ncbi:sugar nucleotide-binding protein [Pseudomonas sp. R2.Fl]|nr:sugar nucleotide-binding protein [Pseudomonas sp. R2.Fl]
MAGTAIMSEGRKRGFDVIGASRAGSDLVIDVEDDGGLRSAVSDIRPAAVINTVADVIVARCEADPGRAWRVNARPVALLADICNEIGAKLVHVSTDHYFSGDGRQRHDEKAPVVLLNEYARTKFAAEALALVARDAVVVRTNIVGFRPGKGDSFAEWCLDVIRNDKEATFFDDQFISSIDIWRFADCVWDLCTTPFRGIINIGSREVFSKADFAYGLAAAENCKITRAKIGSVGIQATRRPDSLGLDVSLAERILGRKMPSMSDVIMSIENNANRANS